jgi:hypothetical protein
MTLASPSRARALYPDGAGESLPFTIANSRAGNESLRAVTVSLLTAPNGDAETAAGADIPGCLARWFIATVGVTNETLRRGGTYIGKVDLTMRDSGTNQDACRNASPAVVVTAS